MTKDTTKEVPANACTFKCGEFEFAETQSDAKLFPFKMKARSAGVISHWYWGRIVHDMSGMQLRKESCPIDYDHNSFQIIGYGKKFTANNEGLQVEGSLVALANEPSDKAYEVYQKGKAGIPYEASIDWRGPGIVIEELSEGASAQVNGETVQGPISIVRKWPLRAVAVTPYGQDSDTRTSFSESSGDEQISVFLFSSTGESEVTNPATSPAAASTQQHSETPASPCVSLDTITQFNDAFGPKANQYLLSGLTFDQANLQFKDERLKALEEENKQLKETSAAAASAAAAATDATKQLADKVLGQDGAINTPAAGGNGAGKKTFSDMFRVPKNQG
jgi:hypothetical protein